MRALKLLAILAVLAPVAWMSGVAVLPLLFGKAPGVGLSPVDQALCALNPDGTAGVLVGGDSRALYHVIPALIEEATGKSCVNVSQWIHLGGDPTSLVNALRKHPLALASRPFVVLSVTLNSVNDLGFKGVPVVTFLNWSPRDHLRTAWERQKAYPRFLATTVLPSLAILARERLAGGGFHCGPDLYVPARLRAEKGFVAYEGRKREGFWNLPGAEEDYILDGGFWKALQASLAWLSASPARGVILLHAPMDTGWLRASDGPVAMAMVERFSRMLAEEAPRHPKVTLWDYYRNPLPELVDSLFYDQTHLNRQGAEILSRDLGRRLAELDARSTEPAGGAGGTLMAR